MTKNNQKKDIKKNLIKFDLSPIKKDNEIRKIIKKINFKFIFFFENLAIVAI